MAHEPHGGEAFGSGTIATFPGATIDVREHGSNPHDFSGWVRAKGEPLILGGKEILYVEGPLKCVNIDGNKAGFTFRVKFSSISPVGDDAIAFIAVEDNGRGRKDKAGFLIGTSGMFHDCRPDTVPMQPLTSGNVTVHPG